MGMGKTAPTISIISDLAKQNKKTLIVSSKLVISETWQNEFEKWSMSDGIKYKIISGSNKDKVYYSDNDVDLITFDGLSYITEISKKEKLKYHCVVFDESSNLKNHSTKRFSNARKWTHLIDMIICLTANPNPNSYHDFWSQYYLLDQGRSLGRTVTEFRQKYFYLSNPRFYEYKVKYGSDLEILESVKHLTFQFSPDEAPYISELNVNKIMLSLPTSARKIYNKVKAEMRAKRKEMNTIKSLNDLKIANYIPKLRQIAQGFEYTEGGVKEIHNTKMNALKEIVELIGDEPKIIAYVFKQDKEYLLKAYPNAVHLSGSMREQDIKSICDKWNSGKIQILICNPASVSHGLNLQSGGRQIIWYSLTYSWEQYTQLIGRLHRTGQTKEVFNHVLCVRNTVDEGIIEALGEKSQNNDFFFSWLMKH